MVRRALIVTALICLTVPSSAIAEKDERSLSIKGLNQEKTEVFMIGISLGVANSNVLLFIDGKPELYCAPDDVAVGGSLLWDLASKALVGSHKANTVAIAAITELRKKYPCKK